MTEEQLPAHRQTPARRASHDDREQVAERLREAAGDGQLDLAELEERLESAFAAKTYAELVPLTADLSGAVDLRLDEPLVLETRAGAIKQTGYWDVPRLISATTDKGSIAIDFTGATCRHREVALELDVRKGSIEVIVPLGWSVTTHGVKVDMGAVENKATTQPAPGSPVLQVTGEVTKGSVQIRYPRWWKRRQRRA
ncbi:hypothetical protein P3T37_003440 [Kitasatospora sp. MAA4]|uniref:DUF1707 SHOCT-like domain-containing protein n=1 Tax=Kitasatospora sp. MAA4 TaxID=3035093 RepID=UPI002476F05E|nr:DUF1707 domain-containing protein [Kitasatospora sp. MAA4]MDH6134041.1 hypothetical protein [Kitasatospora sp. MAA4]